MPKRKSNLITESHIAKNPLGAARIAKNLENRGFKTLIIRPSGTNPYYSILGGKKRKR